MLRNYSTKKVASDDESVEEQRVAKPATQLEVEQKEGKPFEAKSLSAWQMIRQSQGEVGGWDDSDDDKKAKKERAPQKFDLLKKRKRDTYEAAYDKGKLPRHLRRIEARKLAEA